MNKQETETKTDQSRSDQLREAPSLWVEDHLKITDPETEKIIVNTRG